MDTSPRTSRNTDDRITLRAAMVLCLALFLAACGSSGTGVSTEPGEGESANGESGIPVAVEIDETPPSWTLDQSLSFARSVEPFAGDIVSVLETDHVNVIDTTTGDTLASHPLDIVSYSTRTSYHEGVVYITGDSGHGAPVVTRIDTAGIETLEFGSLGFVEHLFDTPVASIVARNDDYAELIRFNPDGQVDRYVYDTSVFIEAVGETIVLGEPDYTGHMWLMDQELNVLDGFSVGEVQNRPALIDEQTVRFSNNSGRFDINLTTKDISPYPPTASGAFDPLVSEFGDGWRVEFADGLVRFIDPAGATVSVLSTEPVTRVSTFEHPTENLAIVTLRTCVNREGNLCNDATSGGDETGGGGSDEGDEVGDEPYVPPAYISVFQLDMDNGEVTALDIGASTSIAVLAVDSGWFAASVDEFTTNILTIDRAGEISLLEELPNQGHDFTMQYVEPVGTSALALIDYQSSQVAILTDAGVLLVEGQALTNNNDWRRTANTFAHLG